MKKVLQLALKGYNPFQSSSKTPHGLRAHLNEEPSFSCCRRNKKNISTCIVIFLVFILLTPFVSCGSPQSVSYSKPIPRDSLRSLPELTWKDLPKDEQESFYRWAIPYLQQCYSMNIFSDEEVKSPGKAIDRKEFLIKICSCLGPPSNIAGKQPYSDIDKKDPFSKTVIFAIQKGILDVEKEPLQDLLFYPNKPIQRWEASLWLANAKNINFSFFEENIVSIFAQDATVEFPSEKAYLAMAIGLSPSHQMLQYRWSKDSSYRLCKPFSELTICEASYSLFHLLFPPQNTSSIDILKKGDIKNTEHIVKQDLEFLSSYIYVSPISKRDMNWGYAPILVEEIPSIEKGTMKCLNDGRIQCTFKIREYLRWSDGSPIIASNAQYGFRFAEQYLSDSVPFDWLLGIKEVSNNVVIVTWKRSFFGVERAFYLYPEPIQEPFLWKSYKTAAPFILRSIENKQLEVERNINCSLYSPVTQSVKIRVVNDEIDFTKEAVQLACNFQSPAVSNIGNGTTISYPSLQWEHIDFKLPNDNLQDKKVRKALRNILSDDDIKNDIWQENCFFSDGWFLPLHPSLQNGIEFESIEGNPVDLLKEAGWNYVENQLEKNGKPFEISLFYLHSDNKRAETVSYIAERWRSLGIHVQVEACDSDAFFSTILKPSPNDSRAFLYSWVFSAESNLFSILHSTAIPGIKEHQVSENYSGFQNQEVDHLLVKTLTEPVSGKRAENIWKIQTIAQEECTVIPLYYVPLFGYIGTSFWGVFVPYSGISLDWAPEYWYLQE